MSLLGANRIGMHHTGAGDPCWSWLQMTTHDDRISAIAREHHSSPDRSDAYRHYADELSEKLQAATERAETAERERSQYKMMFETSEEKLNEYIEKTKDVERDARRKSEMYDACHANLTAAEKRAETAERENERLRLENGALKDENAQLYETEDEKNSWRRYVEQKALEKVEQARAEGYAKRVAEEVEAQRERWCSVPGCGIWTRGKSCPDHPDAPSLDKDPDPPDSDREDGWLRDPIKDEDPTT